MRPVMLVEGLIPEEQAKLDACKTPEEMLALAKEVGYELSEDELEAISGGIFHTSERYLEWFCPTCDIKLEWQKSPKRGYRCRRCGTVYSEGDDPRVVKKWVESPHL